MSVSQYQTNDGGSDRRYKGSGHKLKLRQRLLRENIQLLKCFICNATFLFVPTSLYRTISYYSNNFDSYDCAPLIHESHFCSLIHQMGLGPRFAFSSNSGRKESVDPSTSLIYQLCRLLLFLTGWKKSYVSSFKFHCCVFCNFKN